jgi:hypothetical protein
MNVKSRDADEPVSESQVPIFPISESRFQVHLSLKSDSQAFDILFHAWIFGRHAIFQMF